MRQFFLSVLGQGSPLGLHTFRLNIGKLQGQALCTVYFHLLVAAWGYRGRGIEMATPVLINVQFMVTLHSVYGKFTFSLQ